MRGLVLGRGAVLRAAGIWEWVVGSGMWSRDFFLFVFGMKD